MDYDQQREYLIRAHIEGSAATDERVIAAMRRVPRHEFVPEAYRYRAYDNESLPIGEGQTISQPLIVAKMTEALDVRPEHKVLEIGTGSGYQTAILAELAGEVYTVERRETLSLRAQEVLARLGYESIRFAVADGSLGWPERGPFDRIMVTASSPKIPEPLVEQLAMNGRLVLPVGDYSRQVLTIVDKLEDGLRKREDIGCVFVPLVGRFAWREGEEDDHPER
jgi:protein-L-isoaspartate(D-aspartate) O-methyltransferase